MERKAYANYAHSSSNHISWIERDLFSCYRDSAAFQAKQAKQMLRRVTSRWKIGRTPRVCIVGAGVAGLKCSEVLLENGIDVTILEGRDRIGGRVYQTNQLGHPVDLGANWIHGTDNNPILDIANKTNTVSCPVDEVQNTFDENGKRMDQKKAGEVAALVWGMISDAFKYSNETPSIPADRSLKDYFIQQLEGKDLDEADKRLVMQAGEMFGAFVGEPIEKQSLKYFWLEECLEGGPPRLILKYQRIFFIASTYHAILFEHIAKAATEGAAIKLSTTVTGVFSEDGSSAHPYVKVTTSNSSTPTEYDAVILTVPLGVLKLQNLTIDPPLPTRLKMALRNMTYGRLEKAYITFPTAFWSPDSSNPYPFFTNFLHPTYARATNPSAYIIDCVSLASVPKDVAHPTLLFYMHGPLAEQMTTLLEPYDSTSKKYQELLREFLEPYYSLLPNFSSDNTACTPTGAVATAWQKDKLAGYGSYTNFQIKQDDKISDEDYKLDEDIMALREGMPDRGIWIAGEHTAPFVALGTVTGAWWSGESVGRKVASWFENGDSNRNVAADTEAVEFEQEATGVKG